jgi:hypothetical protein
LLTGAEGLEVLLGVDEGRLVRAAGVARPPELYEVVLPDAHGADLVGAGWLVEDEVSAARAGEAVLAGFGLVSLSRTHGRILPGGRPFRQAFSRRGRMRRFGCDGSFGEVGLAVAEWA